MHPAARLGKYLSEETLDDGVHVLIKVPMSLGPQGGNLWKFPLP